MYGGIETMEKFVVVPKEDKAVTMTIRIDKALQEAYNELSIKTNRSRNELIGMALQYALDNMEIKSKE
jgi:predicted transcriptional regulator